MTPWPSPLDATPPAAALAAPALVSRRASRASACSPSCVAIGYLVLVPLYRLQQLAFEDGAAGLPAPPSTRPASADTITATVGLALGSLAIALVLGTVLAWAATRLLRG